MPTTGETDRGAVFNRRKENTRNARPATDLLFFLLTSR